MVDNYRKWWFRHQNDKWKTDEQKRWTIHDEAREEEESINIETTKNRKKYFTDINIGILTFYFLK